MKLNKMTLFVASLLLILLVGYKNIWLNSVGYSEKSISDAINKSLESDTPILINLGDDSICISCFQTGKILEEVKKKIGEHIEVIDINTSENEEIEKLFEVNKIPTQIFYGNEMTDFDKYNLEEKLIEINGEIKVCYTHSGLLSEEEFLDIFKELK